MKYSLDKYKYYIAGNKVIAVSTYAGRLVKGYAKCDPRDEFDLEKGEKLAALRCGLKIAEKRRKRAANEYMVASKEADRAEKRFQDMKQYYMDATDEFDDIAKEIEDLMKEIG